MEQLSLNDMAEYIDRETLIESVKKYSANINGETTLKCVEIAIRNAPIEDVVPRSEVERLQAQVNRLKAYDEERDIRLHQRLVREAKQEVAEQIFEEIKAKIKLNLDFYSHHTTILANVRAKVDAFSEIEDFLAELKKKYIGE